MKIVNVSIDFFCVDERIVVVCECVATTNRTPDKQRYCDSDTQAQHTHAHKRIEQNVSGANCERSALMVLYRCVSV